MQRSEYLKAALRTGALQVGAYTRKAWIISAFSIIREDPKAYLINAYPYRIIQTPTGFFFVDPDKNGELSPIDDFEPGEPLFRFKDRLVIDSSVCPNAVEPVDTIIGNVLFNLICIVPAFGAKMPFVKGSVSIGALEDIIASRLEDTPAEGEPRNDAVFYVDEYIKFVNAIEFIKGLSQLSVWTATEKTMTSPPGLTEFKNQLIQKYGDTLSDPVQFSAFEKELQAFDELYLKDDPSNGTFLKGKAKNIARKKMYLTIGVDQGFGDSLEANGITNSLEDGWPTDPKQYTNMMNVSRSGSYSRGTETIKGGVSAKILLRSASNFTITETDCGTQLGIRRQFETKDFKQLVGKYIRSKTDWVLIDSIEAAKPFIGQRVIVRSPMYCKLDGDAICQSCAGQRLSRNPTGISSAMTEISSIILATSMKAMHSTELKIEKVDVATMFS